MRRHAGDSRRADLRERDECKLSKREAEMRMGRFGWLQIAGIVLIVTITMSQARAEEIPADQRTRKEQGSPLPLDRSAAAMTLPPGFTATLFAGEPDVHQPIAFCIDHRGRLWV